MSRLTLTLDHLSVNLSSSSNISQVVQPNLVVQSAQVQPADSQGVQFTCLTGQWDSINKNNQTVIRDSEICFFMLHLGVSGSFVPNRIQLKTNISQVTVENGFIADALVYIQFPPSEFPAAQIFIKGSDISSLVLVFHPHVLLPTITCSYGVRIRCQRPSKAFKRLFGLCSLPE